MTQLPLLHFAHPAPAFLLLFTAYCAKRPEPVEGLTDYHHYVLLDWGSLFC